MKSKDIKSMFLQETENVDIPMSEKLKNTPIPPTEVKTTAKPKRIFSLSALKPFYALCLCAILVLGGLFIFKQPTVASAELTAYVIEINPSFCITANSDDVIINVCSLNDDADEVLCDEEFDGIVGKSLEEGVDKIIKVVSANGFFNDYQNVIQIYAVNDDKKSIPAKLDRVGEMINGDLQKYGHGDLQFDKHELPLDDFKTKMGFEGDFNRLDDMKQDIEKHDRFKGTPPKDNHQGEQPPEGPPLEGQPPENQPPEGQPPKDNPPK